MKNVFLVPLAAIVWCSSCSSKIEKSANASASAVDVSQSRKPDSKKLFFDVHNLEPGKVSLEAVAGAHQKDLATQGKFGVNFSRYWVDEAGGKVYCLVESSDSASVYHSHKEAHGLVPDLVEQVVGGDDAKFSISRPLFLDVHELGAGNVNAAAVADAHAKDLAIQGKHGVNFINYWVDEKSGTVRCLVEARDEQALINAHKEAHGLIPKEVHKVKEGY